MRRRPLSLAVWLVPSAALVSPAFAVDYLSVQQAQTLLFPHARRFTEYPLRFTGEQRERIRQASGVRQGNDEPRVWRAERGGHLFGWFIMDEVVGKHEFITFATAISANGKVLGIEVMSYRENHGSEVRQAAWRKHFVGKTVADRLKIGEDVPNISGATLSSRNLTDGVRRLLVIHELFLPPG
jgi:H+/Na+-translocating ferredoxin:NAD+ oxidoreductase subunit G